MVVAGAVLILLAGLFYLLRDGKPAASQSSTNQPAKPPSNDKLPRAIAPFDGDTAKEIQKEWAEHLALPSEREIILPGGVKLTLVLIPPGTFLMGSTEEEQFEEKPGIAAVVAQ